MGFALPLALLLAATVAGPVLAHLVRRTELPRRPFPAVKLLERVAADARSRRRVSDLPLLLARIAIVLGLVLAAAAPFVRVAVLDGDGRVAALGLVIDDSLSMRARDGSPLIDEAFARARAAVSSLPDGSEITVVLGGDPPRLLVDRVQDRDAAIRALRAMRSPVRGDALERATELVSRRLLASRLARRRVVVLSDFARGADAGDLQVPRGFDFEPVVLRPSSEENLGLLVLSAGPGASAGERSVELRAVGHAAREQVTARVLVADDEAAEVTLRPGAAPTTVSFRARRDAQVRVALDIDDALPEDDEADVELANASAPRVLLVNGDPSGSLLADEVAFARRALELAPAALGFRVRVIDESALAPGTFAGNDVVVLANVRTPPAPVIAALRTFVIEGGGLLFAPGDRVNGAEHAARFGDLLPARIGARGDCGIEGVEPPRAGPGLPELIGLDGLVIDACSALEPALGATPWLRAPSGAPLVVAQSEGRGRVAVMAFALDDDDSDFPLRPGFIPSFGAIVRTLSGKAAAAPTPSLPTGESDLRAGDVPDAQRGDAAEGRPSVLERDVAPLAFALFGLLVLLEGVLRERAKRPRDAQRVPSTTRSMSP